MLPKWEEYILSRPAIEGVFEEDLNRRAARTEELVFDGSWRVLRHRLRLAGGANALPVARMLLGRIRLCRDYSELQPGHRRVGGVEQVQLRLARRHGNTLRTSWVQRSHCASSALRPTCRRAIGSYTHRHVRRIAV